MSALIWLPCPIDGDFLAWKADISMGSLEQQFASLSPEQRRLVELWMRRQQTAQAEPPAPAGIARRATTDASPLSFSQQRLWLLQQLEPESPAYNLRTIVRLTGALDPTVLERSLNEIVRRHETLRTRFINRDGQPLQVVAPELHVPLPVTHLTEIDPAQRDARIHELAMAETEQPFDLTRGPMWRARLLEFSADDHILLLTMHHIISDGWSQGVQLRELMALYAAFAEGKPSPLPDLPVQYADYAIWQRESLQGSLLSGQLNYWHERLSHLPHTLDMPTDRPRPVMATYHGSWDYFTLPAALLERIKELSRREGVTLFMTLLAAWNALLYRYTGQTDISVGTPVAGRSRTELEGLIGCFVNMLALRNDLSGNPTFRALLQRVRNITLGAYSHQDVPIEKIIEDLQLDRDLSRNPIFQMMFVLQNMPLPALKTPGLSFSPMEVNSTTSILDLSMYLREVESGLFIRVEYNTDLFDARTIQRMLGHFHMLLESVATDPEQRIGDIVVLTDEERRHLPFVEEALAELWAGMLGIRHVGAHDSFFDVGGDPSKAAPLIARMRDTFHVNLPVRSLFEAPTVAAMAQLLIAREAKPGQTEKIARMLKRIRSMSTADRQQVLEQKRKVRGQA